jgi:hypothetical protein
MDGKTVRVLISNYEIPPAYKPHSMPVPTEVQKLLGANLANIKVLPRRAEIQSENPSAYVLKVEHLPWGSAAFTVKRLRITKTEDLALLEEKNGKGGKIELSNPLPPPGVELFVLQRR